LDAIAKAPGPVYATLRKSIGDPKKADGSLAPTKRGFNIEGMTTMADGRTVLVGLRNPLSDGKAIVFRIENVEELVDGRASEPRLGEASTVDLGGRGIRDIAWSPAHGAYLIAAGQVDDDDAGPGFAIFAWSPSGMPREIHAFGDVNRDYVRFRPEAVVPLTERSDGTLAPSKRVLIISDDGTKRVSSGNACKAASAAEKSFRGIIRLVD
jgi:hypothetical protein